MIRPNWRQIKFKALTDEERALAEPSIREMVDEAMSNIRAAAERWRSAFDEKLP